jgi:hypothetical protein
MSKLPMALRVWLLSGCPSKQKKEEGIAGWKGSSKKIGLLKIDKESEVLSTVNIEIIKIISNWAF